MPAAPDGQSASGPLTAAEATSVVLRAALVPTAVVGLLAVVLATVLRGTPGLVAALLGVVIVIGFFASGQYAVGRILSHAPHLALSAALLVYLSQIIVLFLVIALLQDATWLDPKVFAATVLVCTLVWTGMSVVASQRTKVLYVEPVSSVDDAGGSADSAADAGQEGPTTGPAEAARAPKGDQ